MCMNMPSGTVELLFMTWTASAWGKTAVIPLCVGWEYWDALSSV